MRRQPGRGEEIGGARSSAKALEGGAWEIWEIVHLGDEVDVGGLACAALRAGGEAARDAVAPVVGACCIDG